MWKHFVSCNHIVDNYVLRIQCPLRLLPAFQPKPFLPLISIFILIVPLFLVSHTGSNTYWFFRTFGNCHLLYEVFPNFSTTQYTFSSPFSPRPLLHWFSAFAFCFLLFFLHTYVSVITPHICSWKTSHSIKTCTKKSVMRI